MKRAATSALLAILLAGFGCQDKPDVADPFDAVRAEIAALKADTGRLGECHERMHAIGQASFGAYGVSALSLGDEWCNAGYIHGVVESALAQASDPIAEMKSLCGEADPSTFSGWECWHGIGHGLMDYTGNDLPRVIETLCPEVGNGKMACVNGALMENFGAETEIHPTNWRRDDDSFYPCDYGIWSSGVSECYLYAPIWYLERHDHDYAAAFDWCSGAVGRASTCARGVGGQAMKDGIADPERAAEVCALAEGELRENCIGGMTAALAFHGASVEAAEAWCEGRSGNDRVACDKEIMVIRPLFD